MNNDITYCQRGIMGHCPKSRDCARVAEDEDNYTLRTWFFAGCDTESTEYEYFYKKQ
jgi:hypothetical protein